MTLALIHSPDPLAGAAGEHYVEVVERGPKWVRIRNPHLPGEQCRRVPRREFDRMVVRREEA